MPGDAGDAHALRSLCQRAPCVLHGEVPLRPATVQEGVARPEGLQIRRGVLSAELLHLLGEAGKQANQPTNWSGLCEQAGEKDKEDGMVDALGPNEVVGMKNVELHGLKRQLAERDDGEGLDGYACYL